MPLAAPRIGLRDPKGSEHPPGGRRLLDHRQIADHPGGLLARQLLRREDTNKLHNSGAELDRGGHGTSQKGTDVRCNKNPESARNVRNNPALATGRTKQTGDS